MASFCGNTLHPVSPMTVVLRMLWWATSKLSVCNVIVSSREDIAGRTVSATRPVSRFPCRLRLWLSPNRSLSVSGWIPQQVQDVRFVAVAVIDSSRRVVFGVVVLQRQAWWCFHSQWQQAQSWAWLWCRMIQKLHETKKHRSQWHGHVIYHK